MIDSFSGTMRFLSNFSRSDVVLDGVTYPTVEHAYQAAKCADASKRVVFLQIGADDPAFAKRLGRRVKLRPDWEEIKIDVMRDLLRSKFADPALRAKLIATGDRPLIEGNHWGDRFWGVCNGKGENHLGRLLVEVRSEIRSTSEDGS